MNGKFMRKWFIGLTIFCAIIILAFPKTRQSIAQVIPCTYGFISGTSFCAGTPVPLATPTTTAGPTAAATSLPSPATTATDLKAPQIRQTTVFAPSASNGVVPLVLPTTPAYADILVAAITISLLNDSNRTIQPPPGWYTLDPLTSSTFNSLPAMQTFYHIVYGADNGTYTFYEKAPSGQFYAASGILYDIYGEDPANPIGTHAIGTQYNSTLYLPGISYSKPSSAHTLTLGFWGLDGGTNVTNETISLGAAASPFIIDNFANAVARSTISVHASNISISTTPYTTISITNNQPYVDAIDNIQPIGVNAAPTPTPTPSPIPSFSPSPTPTPTVSPTPVPTSSIGPSPNASGQLQDNFSSDLASVTPNLIKTINYNSLGPTQWQVYNLTGTNVFGEPSGGQPEDIAYYNIPTPLNSLSETYSFVYNGPTSVVEPFIVTSITPLAGYNINLSQSFVGNYLAGSTTLYSSTGNTNYSHLKTEPYYYQLGHTYRVDIVADQTTSILSARVYDLTTNQQSPIFDGTNTIVSGGLSVYPGIWNESGGPTIVKDIQFGPSGNLLPFPHPANRAYDFNNYQGMNLSSNTTAAAIPKSAAAQGYISYLPQLRIKHLRATATTIYQPVQNAIESAATALNVPNYSVDATCLVSYTTTVTYLENTLAPAMNTGGCESLELPNEPNQGGPDSNYNTDIPIQAACFSAAVSSGGLPTVKNIWGPSLVANPVSVFGNMKVVVQPTASPCPQSSPIGSYITATNVHPYLYATVHLPESNGGYTGATAHIAIASPIPYLSGCGNSLQEDCGYSYAVNEMDNYSESLVGANEPIMSTEGVASYGASYNQSICATADVDFNTQQAYIQRGLLYNYNIGHIRAYPFDFGDFGVGPVGNPCNNQFNSYGLLEVINNPDSTAALVSPKQSFTALAYFNQILFDTGSSAATFTSSPLTYSLVGQTPDILTTLLQESDGSYRLIIWSDKQLCSEPPATPCTPIAPVNTTLTLNLANSATVEDFQQVYGSVGAPGSGAFQIVNTFSGTSFTLTNINQYPTILAIYPSTISATPIPLPTGISTPGPPSIYETPMPPTPSPFTSPTSIADGFDTDTVNTIPVNWQTSEVQSPWVVGTLSPYSSPNSYGDNGGVSGDYSWINLYYAPQVEMGFTFTATSTTACPVSFEFVTALPSSVLTISPTNGAITYSYYLSGTGLQNISVGTETGGFRSTYVFGATYGAKALVTYTGSSDTIQTKVWNMTSPEPTYGPIYTDTTSVGKSFAPGFRSATAAPYSIDNFTAAYNGATLPTVFPTASPTPSPGPT